MRCKIFGIAYLAFALIVLKGCSTQVCSCSPSPNADITFSIVDSNGEDRLDPNHPNSLSENNLEIYYLKDDKKERVFEGNLDYPKNFKIYHFEPAGKFLMMLWPSNHIEEGGNATTFIEFPDGTVDTVTMKPLNENANTAERFWYDGKLVWKIDSDYTMPIKITKPVPEN